RWITATSAARRTGSGVRRSEADERNQTDGVAVLRQPQGTVAAVRVRPRRVLPARAVVRGQSEVPGRGDHHGRRVEAHRRAHERPAGAGIADHGRGRPARVPRIRQSDYVRRGVAEMVEIKLEGLTPEQVQTMFPYGIEMLT